MAAVNADDLYHAIEENDAARLAELLENGGDVDVYFEDTMSISTKSLLHVCCGKGYTDCLRVLIDHGAKLDARDKWGQTPLMYCVIIQFPENAKILLEACPDLSSCQDRYGKSSLHCAVEVGSVELVSMLLQHGADVNIRNHDGFTPLMISCSCLRDEEQIGILKELIHHGAIIDLYDYKGKRTALHIATVAGNFKAVEILVDAGADVNMINKDLRTPLTNAIFMGARSLKENYKNIIEYLVSSGADLETSVCESSSPLLACAQVKSASLMEFFLSNGANPNAKFPSGITAALVSASLHDLSTLKVLINFNCDLTIQGLVYKRRRNLEFMIDAFQMALMEGTLDICILIILAGYPISKTWNDKETEACLKVSFPDFVLDKSHRILDGGLSIPELCDKNDTKLPWIIAKSKQARSLQDECVFTIRAAMGRCVNMNVNSLPLPKALRDYVSLKHILTMF